MLILFVIAYDSYPFILVKHTITGGTVAEPLSKQLILPVQLLCRHYTHAKYESPCLIHLIVCKHHKAVSCRHDIGHSLFCYINSRSSPMGVKAFKQPLPAYLWKSGILHFMR